jgi:hypothetical protein
MASASAGSFLDAPDVYFAAAVMNYESFYMGKGDRTEILNMILRAPETCKAIKDKLILLQKDTFLDKNFKLFKDNWQKGSMSTNIRR